MTIKDLTKNKSVMFGLIIVGLVLLIALFSGGKPTEEPSSSPSPSVQRLEIIDLKAEKRRQAADYRQQIISLLPIYVEKFSTSVGIDTSINLYVLGDDPLETVRLEIYGLSYLNPESDPTKNPNVTAFQESYKEAMRLLHDKGIDPKRLIFLYGDKEYVRVNAAKWIDALKLSP